MNRTKRNCFTTRLSGRVPHGAPMGPAAGPGRRSDEHRLGELTLTLKTETSPGNLPIASSHRSALPDHVRDRVGLRVMHVVAEAPAPARP